MHTAGAHRDGRTVRLYTGETRGKHTHALIHSQPRLSHLDTSYALTGVPRNPTPMQPAYSAHRAIQDQQSSLPGRFLTACPAGGHKVYTRLLCTCLSLIPNVCARLQDDYILEMIRFGAAELHVVASIMGGIAAQVKLWEPHHHCTDSTCSEATNAARYVR